MICALADAGAALPGADGRAYTDAAVACAEFLHATLRDERGRLLRSYGAGGSGSGEILGYLEDHAFLLEALITLFEATCEEHWFHRAQRSPTS